MATFTTSKLARQSGVNLESIRFYERQGLLRKPARTAGGYRMFTHDDVRSVLFIKRAQELAFSLKEIKELLALRFAPGRRCSEFRARAQAKLDDIDGKLSDLSACGRLFRGLPVLVPDAASSMFARSWKLWIRRAPQDDTNRTRTHVP